MEREKGFHFNVSEEGEEFCNEIIEEMIIHFEISESEALGRINREWANRDFVSELDIRYHDLPREWAYMMYYGRDSFWWKRLNDPTLEPIPYP